MKNIEKNSGIDQSIFDAFINSDFYNEYKNTYAADQILKKVFICNIGRCHNWTGKKQYSDILGWNIKVIRDLLSMYAKDLSREDDGIIWKMIYAFYIDPDGSVDNDDRGMRNGIKCTADGLLSIRRIYCHVVVGKGENRWDNFLKEYEKYRAEPLIFFPEESGGINISRANSNGFGDRIDYTLFDIRRYYMNNKKADLCRLQKAFEREQTKMWLDSFENFAQLADWMKIKGIFTDSKYRIYDIENWNGEEASYTLKDSLEYLPRYSWDWSERYYDNIKRMIDSAGRGNIHGN